jgi:hypothetical protein
MLSREVGPEPARRSKADVHEELLDRLSNGRGRRSVVMEAVVGFLAGRHLLIGVGSRS